MINVVYDKKDKDLGKKIENKLRNNGFKQITSISFDRNEIRESEGVIFVISGSDSKKLALKHYKNIFDQDLPVIFFLTNKLDTEDLFQWHFKNTVDWIDATAKDKTPAIDALVNYINELQNNQGQPKKKNIASIIVAIILVMAAIYFMFFNSKPESQIAEKEVKTKPTIITTNQISEKNLIGTWYLYDYKDDIPRNAQDQRAFEQTISQLKRNFRFIFYDDHTFVRYGFNPQGDRGYWQLDAQNKVIYISDLNNVGKDKLQIKKLTENEFIFEVASYLDNKNIAIVTFYLRKQQ